MYKTKNFDSSNTIRYKNIDDIITQPDLSIVDPLGNEVLVVDRGYIKTKNFDSRYINQSKTETVNINVETTDYLAKFAGKRFSLIGDSISTYEGYAPNNTIPDYDGSNYAIYYPRGDVDSVEKTYWYMLCEELGMILNQNCAWSGSAVRGNSSSTSNAAAGCSTKRILDLGGKDNESPDIVLIFIGINDFPSGKLGNWNETTKLPEEGTVEEFCAAYALMVYKIQVNWPDARIFCCSLMESITRDTTEKGTYPTENNSGETLGQYNSKIKAELIAKY